MPARTFHMCPEDVKTAPFRADCAPLYQLTCGGYTEGTMKKIQVAFNCIVFIPSIKLNTILLYIIYKPERLNR